MKTADPNYQQGLIDEKGRVLAQWIGGEMGRTFKYTGLFAQTTARDGHDGCSCGVESYMTIAHLIFSDPVFHKGRAATIRATAYCDVMSMLMDGVSALYTTL